ncbi:MAG: hypothetical protein ACM3JH_00250, partial [Acidithiobacillales bacterium]
MREARAGEGSWWGRWVRRGAWAAGLAGAGLGLAAALAREDRRGERTLAPLAGLMEAATGAGRLIADFAHRHGLLLGAAALLAAAAACAVFGRTRSLKARCVLSAALGLLFVAVLLLSAGHAGWAGL